jgi:hypothetical protein
MVPFTRALRPLEAGVVEEALVLVSSEFLLLPNMVVVSLDWPKNIPVEEHSGLGEMSNRLSEFGIQK